MVIQWSKNAEYQFQQVIANILLYSTKYADQVKTDIIKLVKTLADHPERFPLDKFKRNNDGSFRALELYHYRISYRVIPRIDVVLIIRVRHTARSPREY